jgi:hypothetical protein
MVVADKHKQHHRHPSINLFVFFIQTLKILQDEPNAHLLIAFVRCWIGFTYSTYNKHLPLHTKKG